MNRDERSLIFIDDYAILPMGFDFLIIREVMKQPLIASMDVGNAFDDYEGGIFYGEDENDEENELSSHTVEIVGFGTEGEGEEAQEYLIIKNSYGLNWGMDGFMHVWRDKRNRSGVCNINSCVKFPILNIAQIGEVAHQKFLEATSSVPTPPSKLETACEDFSMDGRDWTVTHDCSRFPMDTSSDMQVWERRLLYCVPREGGFSSESSHPQEPTTEGISPSTSVLPDFDRNSLPCLVKIHDSPESYLKLNDVFEFVGVLTFDPEHAVDKDDPDELANSFCEDALAHLPPSKVPHLHCIMHQKLAVHDFLSGSPVMEPKSHLMNEIREALLGHLTAVLGNDEVAAHFMLFNLLSRVHARVDTLAVGKLSLNLTCFSKESVSVFGNRLDLAVKNLLPFTHCIPLTVDYLNTASLAPRKDYQTNRLVSGVLQLAEGSHLTIDETQLQAGTLKSTGVENARLLKNLMELQKREGGFGSQSSHPQEPTTEGISPSTSMLPDFDRNSLPCLVKIYDSPESDLKLNDVFEFVGILTFDPKHAVDKDDPDELANSFCEDALAHLPPSKVPCLHCIMHQKLAVHDFLSGSPVMEPKFYLIKEIREALLGHLTGVLGNDGVAAHFILLHLLSTVHARVDTLAVGKLSLNLSCFSKESVSVFGNRLNLAVKNLLPFTKCIPLTVDYLNTASLTPRKDYQTNRLVSGVLQLAEGLHLTIDETQLQAGTLNTTRVENARLLKNLMELQKVEYDFKYYKMEMAVDVQLLILSEGKSNILPADLVLPFRPSSVGSSEIVNPEALKASRWYLATLRSLPHSIESEMQKVVEDDLVAARQADRRLGSQDFSRWLTMGRLMSVSFGETSLPLEHWQMVKELERLRRGRGSREVCNQFVGKDEGINDVNFS